MADPKRIERAFVASRKRRQAVFFLDCGDVVAATGEDFVRVTLMADVPDHAIFRRVVEIVQGHGQFDHTQTRAKMAAGRGDRFDQVGAQLARNRRQFAFVEQAQVGGRIDAGKARIALGIDHCKRFQGPSAIFGH